MDFEDVVYSAYQKLNRKYPEDVFKSKSIYFRRLTSQV
jgi:hypothetical protein